MNEVVLSTNLHELCRAFHPNVRRPVEHSFHLGEAAESVQQDRADERDEDGNTEVWFINDAYLGEDGKYYQTEEARDTANADEVDETEATTEGV